jgi:hypothetical protein
MGLDQIADALRAGFAVAVAGDGVGAAGGLDANVGKDHAGGDVDGGDLGDGDALLISDKLKVAAEPARLHAADPLRADDELGGEEEVALSPAAGGEGCGLGGGWGGHGVMVRRGRDPTASTLLENWGTHVHKL